MDELDASAPSIDPSMQDSGMPVAPAVGTQPSLVPGLDAPPAGQEFIQPGAPINPAFSAPQPVDMDHVNLVADAMEKYGDRPITAAAVGAASGLTLGVSDQIIKRVLNKIEPESGTKLLQGLDVFNPTATNVGIGIGLIGPAAVSALSAPETLGAGAVEGATEIAGELSARAALHEGASALAEFGGPGLVSKLGKITESALGDAIKGSRAEKILGQVMSKGAALSAGSAVEGAAYGAGNLLREDALGTAPLNAENLIAALGTGAMVGGLLGPAGAALGAGAAKLTAGLSKIVDSSMSKILDPVSNSWELMGGTPKKAAKFIKLMGEDGFAEFQKDAMPIFRDEVLAETDSTDQFVNWRKTYEVKQDVGQQIQDGLEDLTKRQVEGVGYQTSGTESTNFLETPKIYRAGLQALNEFVSNNSNSLTSAAKEQLQGLADRMEAAMRNIDMRSVDKAWGMRKEIDQLAKWGRNVKDFSAEAGLRQIRGAMQEQILQVANKISPEIGQTVAESFKRYSTLANMENVMFGALGKGSDAAKSMLLTTAGAGLALLKNPVLGIMTGAGGTLKTLLQSDFKRKLAVLGSIEHANQTSAAAIVDGVKNFFEKNPQLSTAAKAAFKMEAVQIAQNPNGSAPKDKQAAFQNVSNRLSAFVSNPTAAQDRLAKQTAVIHNAAPNTATQYGNTLANNMAYLYQKMPKNMYDISIPGVQSRTFQPSDADLAKFSRTLQVAENPHSVLNELNKGTLTRDHIEALQTMYPTVYANIRAQMAQQLGQMQAQLPYQKRVQLGILMDLPTDHSLLGTNVMQLQSTWAPIPVAAPQGKSGRGGPSYTRTKNMGFAGRAMTGSEAVLSRRQK